MSIQPSDFTKYKARLDGRENIESIVRDMLKALEGDAPNLYLDGVSGLSIGYGFNLMSPGAKDTYKEVKDSNAKFRNQPTC